MLKEENIFEFIRTQTGVKNLTTEAVMKTTGDPDASTIYEDLESIVNEVMTPRGSTFDKIAARQDAAGKSRPVATKPAIAPQQNVAARTSAFEKQKAVWAQQAKAKAAAVPADVAARHSAMAEKEDLPIGVRKQRGSFEEQGSSFHAMDRKTINRMKAVADANKRLDAKRAKQPPLPKQVLRQRRDVPMEMAGAGGAGAAGGASGGAAGGVAAAPAASTGSGAISANNIARSDNANMKRKMRRPVKTRIFN